MGDVTDIFVGVLDVMKADRDGWRDQARRLLLADQRDRRPLVARARRRLRR